MKSLQREMMEQQGQNPRGHEPGKYGLFENREMQQRVYRAFQQKLMRRKQMSQQIQESGNGG